MLINNQNIDLKQYAEYSYIRNNVVEKSELQEKLVEYFDKINLGNIGDQLPFKTAHNRIGFRKGELTIVGGINGHGKSLFLGQLCLSFIQGGARVLIASLEMPMVASLARMSRQAIGVNSPSREQIEQFTKWKYDHFYLYNHVGNLEPWQVVALCRYAADVLKADHIVIDSLMKCSKGEQDYDGQKDFVNLLCEVAKEVNIHIFLVHHVRKGNNENAEVGKFDLKGSGAIADLTDNILIINRNKAKEKETYNNRGVADNSIPDAALIIAKQRHGEWEGSIPLWFDSRSQQFKDDFRLPINNFMA